MKRLIVIYDPVEDPEFPFVWRLREGEHWMGSEARGDIDQLHSASVDIDAPLWLLLPTQQGVVLKHTIGSGEQRLFRKVIPFELEEQIITDIDDIHFVYSGIEEQRVTVAYTQLDWLEPLIESIDDREMNLQLACLEAQLLPWQSATMSIRWRGESAPVEIRYGADLVCAVSAESLELTLRHLGSAEDVDAFDTLNLYADSHEQLDCLQELLPESLSSMAQRHQWNRWESLDIPTEAPLNWLQGNLSRSLPIARWWQEWRWPVFAGAAALLVFLVSSYGELLQLKSEQRQHLANAEQAYRQVVPSGALVDPEVQLSNQLKKFGVTKSRDYPSALQALTQVSPTLESAEGVKVTNIYYYNGELRLNIETANFQQIEQLRTSLGNQSISAELVNSSAVNDGHQARMRITL